MTQKQSRAHRSRLRVLEAALQLFEQRGYDAARLKDVAAEAGVSVGLACRYFPTKEHLALAIYSRLAEGLVEAVVELPEGTVAERFAMAMRHKLSLIEPHRRALIALAGKALDPRARAGVLGEAAEPIRSRVAGVFSAVVRGASDAPNDPEALARHLYAAHLGLILLWTQSNDTRAIEALALDAGKLLPLLTAFAPAGMTAQLERLVGRQLPKHHGDLDATAHVILQRLFRRRRVYDDVPQTPGEAAFSVHLPRVRSCLRNQLPIQLVLPAFPAKAPNPNKVLGSRPDTAEQLALVTLTRLLDELSEAHEPGVELVICSDGTVFADVVGVRDEDVVQYRTDLEAMLRDLGETRVRMFDLADAFGSCSPDEARETLLSRYAQTVDDIRARAKRSVVHKRQLDGIHRFLIEDEVAKEDGRSKTAIRKQTRSSAYEVVRRSDAWGALVSAAFPAALRLSIHPQPDVSAKIGIHLLETKDAWLTPWHGCAVLRGDNFTLEKRATVKNASIVDVDGRPGYLAVRA